MATAEDYVIFEERCRLHAHQSAAHEVKQVWLSLAETYRTLLALDRVPNSGPLISGKRAAIPEASNGNEHQNSPSPAIPQTLEAGDIVG